MASGNDELLQDVEAVNELGMTTVDYYTLNNVVAQPRMHRAFAEQKLQPLSANTKLSYRIFLNEYLRAQGYIPNNSYSFTRSKAAPGAPRAVIQRDPVFLYQEITYGFTDDYVDAYGPGAHSHFGEFLINNIANREQYAARLLSENPQPWFIAYSDLDVSSKGIVYFPYRGFLEKSSVEWDKVEAEVRASLDDIVKCGLAVEHSDHYELTEVGWLFAVNLMYMLMPRRDQAIFSEFIARQNASPDRKPDDVIFIPRKHSVVPAISAD